MAGYTQSPVIGESSMSDSDSLSEWFDQAATNFADDVADLATNFADDGARFNASGQLGALADPDSNASLKLGDGSFDASLSDAEGGGSFHIRGTGVSANTGNILGPLEFSAHAGEADGYGSASSDKMGIGGHLDTGGIDARLGDSGTHVAAGVSSGIGLGFEVATGEDTDGDGYGEWGMRGEGGPLSASVRFEPGAVVDTAGELVDEGEQVVADLVSDPQETVEQWSNQVVEGATSAWDGAADQLDDLLSPVDAEIDLVALDPATVYTEDSPAVDYPSDAEVELVDPPEPDLELDY